MLWLGRSKLVQSPRAIFSLDDLALPPLAQLSVHPSPLAVAITQVQPAYTSFCFPHQPVTGQGNMQRGNAKQETTGIPWSTFHDPIVPPNILCHVLEPQPQIVHASTSLSSPPACKQAPGKVGNKTANAPIYVSWLMGLGCLFGLIQDPFPLSAG